MFTVVAATSQGMRPVDFARKNPEPSICRVLQKHRRERAKAQTVSQSDDGKLQGTMSTPPSLVKVHVIFFVVLCRGSRLFHIDDAF